MKLLIGLVCVLGFFCDFGRDRQSGFESCSIAIYSPYGCLHTISLDDRGSGDFLVQYTAWDSVAKSIDYDTVANASFKITSKRGSTSD